MMPPHAIEVVGGGLAGLSLGLALQRAGVDVAIAEAGNYPRHRVCGEFITGLPDRTRERLGLDALLADARLNHEVAWFSRGAMVRRQRLPAPALGLSRYTLDTRLADAFVAAGGMLHTHTRSDTVADAPGRLFATGRRRARSPWIGLKIHAVALSLSADLELHLGDSAYVGLARVEGDRVNVCGLFRRRAIRALGSELIFRYLIAAGLESLAHRLHMAETDAASFCAVAGVEFDRRVAPASPVRLGDACAVIPPFTGHGMAMAFQSAELALDPLLAFARGRTSWDSTRAAVHQALHRRFRVRLASANWLHSFLLRPARQRWLEQLNRTQLLPLRPLYSLLHG